MIRVRFAPRPTGLLLVSGARVAFANYLFARRNNGQFLLRFDDLDEDRPGSAHSQQIIHDLRWLGIDWHASFSQLERQELYQDTITHLKQSGRCTPASKANRN